METNVNSSYTEEISLREIIEILIKGWKLIAAVTLIALAVSTVFSFFVIPPVYESEASVFIKPTNITWANGNTYMTLDRNFMEDDIETLKTHIMYGSNSIEREVSYMVASLMDMSDFNNESIAVRLKDREIIERIYADTGINLAGIDKYTVSVVADETNIIGIKVSGEDPEACALLANQLAGEAGSIYMDEAIVRIKGAREFVLDSIDHIGASVMELENALSLNSGAGQTADRAKKEYKLINARLAYNEFVKQEILLDLAGEIDYGKTAAQIISNAEVPSKPVSPRKVLNIIIAGLLGLMISVFIVLFKDYWEKTAQEGSFK